MRKLTWAVGVLVISIMSEEASTSRRHNVHSNGKRSDSSCINPPDPIPNPVLKISESKFGYDDISYFFIGVETQNYSRLLDIDNTNCEIKYSFSIDGNSTHQKRKHRHRFRGLKPGSFYNISATIHIGQKSSNASEFIRVDTYAIGVPGINLQEQADSLGRYRVKWGSGNISPDYLYRIKWRGLACSDEIDWSVTGYYVAQDRNLQVPLNEYPFSLIKVSVWKKDPDGWRGRETYDSFNYSRTGIPENKVTNISCNEVTCRIRVENDCQKQHNEHVILKYNVEPAEVTLRELYKNSTINGSVHIGQLQTHFLTLPEFFKLPYTAYSVEVNLASENGTTNNSSLIKTEFRTKPTVPLRVQELHNISASANIIVIQWRNPPEIPPTGELEKFRINWKERDGASRSFLYEWVSKDRHEFQITELNPDKYYLIRVEAKNKDVDSLSDYIEISAKTNRDKPTAPSNIGTKEELTSSISFSIQNRQGKQYNPQDAQTFSQMKIDGFELKNLIINCSKNSGSITPVCKAENLPSGRKFEIVVRNCKREECSGWVLNQTVWTRPFLPTINKVTLNKEDTSMNKIAVHIDTTNINKIADKILYLVVQKDGASISHEEIRETIKSCQKKREPRKECQTSRMGSLWIYRNITQTAFYFTDFEIGFGYNFACGVLLQAGYHIEVGLSPFSELFYAQTTISYHLLSIVLGTTGAVIFSAAFIICFIKIRKKPKQDSLIDESAIPHTGVQNPAQKRVLAERRGSKRLTLSSIDHAIIEEETYGEVCAPIRKTRAASSDAECHVIEAIYSPHLQAEFQTVPTMYPEFGCSDGSSHENSRKNRYKNNLPYDETRVMLPSEPGQSDYINASFVDTPFRSCAFIASQGPKCDAYVDTRTDFYRMLWYTGASHVIMVANLVEGGRTKVSQYWPGQEQHSESFGSISVFLQSSQISMDFIIRVLVLQKENEIKQVYHYQYTAWPDHGVPSNCYSLCQMIKMINSELSWEHPIVVHCSAGIGRTGTILLIFEAFEQLHQGYIDVLEALTYLRKGRPRLVENVIQYRFGHELLWECLTMDSRNISIENFLSNVKSQNIAPLTEEYQLLKSLNVSNTYENASLSSLSHLNRNCAILPPDDRMIYLSGYGDSEEDQYINAVKIHGYDKENSYIVMEHPMANTLHKAWSLILKYKIEHWILLNEFEDNIEEFPEVIPSSGAFTLNKLRVKIISKDMYDYFHEYEVNVEMSVKKISQSCKVYKVFGWKYMSDLPTDSRGLLGVISRVKSTVSPGPLLISCGDGVTACGLCVSVLYILSRLELTQEVNVFNSVVPIIYARPQFIPTENQYRYLQTMVASYMKNFSEYSNFA